MAPPAMLKALSNSRRESWVRLFDGIAEPEDEGALGKMNSKR